MTTQGSLPAAETAPGEPADADLDGDWVCPPCKRGRCDRCTDRDCCCCGSIPYDSR